MTSKQVFGKQSKDGSMYYCFTDGNGNLTPFNSKASTGTKNVGIRAPDGSLYITLTDGNSNLL